MPRFLNLFAKRSACALLTCLLASQAGALHDESAPQGAPLTLEETAALAVTVTPALRAQAASVRAAAEDAVAAGQLPDPKLKAGVSELPVTTRDAFSLRRDSDTDIMLGIEQEIPRAAKRKLQTQRGQREAALAEVALAAESLQVQRTARLAWMDVYMPMAQQRLLGEQVMEAEGELQAQDIAYRAGRARQADLLAARVEFELLRDRVRSAQQMQAHARNQLTRWIGEAAWRPLPEQLPGWPAPAAFALLRQRLAVHPQLAVLGRETEVAQTDIALARQSYKPDWSVGLAYGYRPDFSDMLTVQVGMDLPLFTAKRQDRRLAANQARLEAVEARQEDLLRELEAQLRLNEHDWRQLQARLALYSSDILPQARARIEAARAAYAAGAGDFNSILIARRALLEVQMQQLELQVDAARHWLELDYLAPAAAHTTPETE
ncbi:MAG: TolC family protein [Nevskiales bacterium]